MALVQCSLLFRQQTNLSRSTPGLSRVGAWSEGWWFSGDPAEAMTRLVTLSPFRARCLTKATRVIGQRVRVLGGASTTNNQSFPGTLDIRGDIPQMGLLCSVKGVGRANVRHFVLRGLPDARVEEGEFDPNADFLIAIRAYVQQVGTQQFAFKCNDLTFVAFPLLTIDDTGHALFSEAASFGANKIVQGLRVKSTVTDKVISFRLPVVAGADPLHWTIQGWTSGEAKGGRIRQVEVAYPQVDGGTFDYIRVTTHKVGKDFFQFHGRASKKT